MLSFFYCEKVFRAAYALNHCSRRRPFFIDFQLDFSFAAISLTEQETESLNKNVFNSRSVRES